MVNIEKTDIINDGEDVEQWKTLIHCWWECQMAQLLWGKVWQFFKKLNIYLPIILLLRIYPREIKIYIHKKWYKNIHSNFINISSKLEITQVLGK